MIITLKDFQKRYNISIERLFNIAVNLNTLSYDKINLFLYSKDHKRFLFKKLKIRTIHEHRLVNELLLDSKKVLEKYN